MAALGACAALSCAGVQVRSGDRAWLEQCPPEARRTVETLGLGWEGLAWLDDGPNVRTHKRGCEVRDGPVEIYPALDGLTQKTKLIGTIRTGDDGASIRFHTLVLMEDQIEYPICGLAFEEWDWGPGIDRPKPEQVRAIPASEKTPGFIYVTTGNFQLLLAR